MCNVTFWKDKDFSGHNKNYDGPIDITDTNDIHWTDHSSDDMKDDISSIQTDGSAWVQIYSSTDHGGRTTLIGPNSNVNLDEVYDDEQGKDMDDTIQSFEIFDNLPLNITAVINNFIALYPGATSGHNSDYKDYLDIYSQDSEYWVYYPEIDITGNVVAFTVNLSHRQSETDDQATLTFSMNGDGRFVDSIKVSYTMAEATQIPDWMITIIDDAIEVASVGAMAIADGAEIVLTDGVGVVATVETDELIEDIADALTFCVDHLNAVLNAVFKLQDDGGAMNFAAVVSQCISRTVLAYYQELFGPDENTVYWRSSDRFLDSLSQNSSLTDVDSSWNTSKHTQYVTFTYDDTDDEYRSYLPDASFFYAKGGSVLSTKIDYVDSLSKDDHLISQAIFDPKGELFALIGNIDLYDGSSDDDYKAPTSGVLTYNADSEMIHITKDDDGNDTITVLTDESSLESAYASMLSASLTATGSDFDITISQQQSQLIDVSLAVISAMKTSIVM
ncbi:MAG: hypothetical protein AB8B56_15065 [Crocinitomicaceae bacterium]